MNTTESINLTSPVLILSTESATGQSEFVDSLDAPVYIPTGSCLRGDTFDYAVCGAPMWDRIKFAS